MKETKKTKARGAKGPGAGETAIRGVGVRELTTHYDSRGWLTELWRSDGPEKRKPAMMYVSSTGMRITRGPHEHRRQTDVFVFLGAFRVRLWDARKGSGTEGRRMDVLVSKGRPTLVVVPPGVVHAYESMGEGGLVLNMPDKLYAGRGGKGAVDEIRHENDAFSKYGMD